MSQVKREKKFFYGWIIVIACTLLSATSTGMLSYFNALFVVPITQDLQISRASFSLHTTFSSVTTMILMPFIGVLFRKHSIKRLIFLGAVLGASAHLSYSMATNVFGFYLGGVLAGIARCLYSSIPMTILLANWFNAKRGMVTGIAFTGCNIVSSLFSPFVSDLIVTHGWRFSYRALAIAILVFTTLNVVLIIRVKPSDMGQEPYGEIPSSTSGISGEQIGLMRKDTIRTPAFWLLGLSMFILGLCTMGTQFQLVAYWSASASVAIASKMYALVMLVGIFAKVFLGGLFDYCGINKTVVICCATSALAMVSLIIFTNGTWIIIPAVLFGMTTSVQVMTSTYLTNKFFGPKDYGSNFGTINTMLFLGISFAGPVSGFIFDFAGTYKVAWALYGALMVVVMVSLLAANRLSKISYKQILGVERDM